METRNNKISLLKKTMKKTFTLVALCLTCLVTNVNAQFHTWTKLNEGDVNGEAHPEFVRTNENASTAVIQVGRFVGTIE